MASSIETTSTTTTLKNNGNVYLSVDTNDDVTVTNDLSVSGTTTLSTALPVASGGTGATALTNLNVGIGAGQTWQALTGSRALSTNYTNSTGRSIGIIAVSAGTNINLNLIVDSITVNSSYVGSGISGTRNVQGIIPSGSVYSVTSSSSLNYWNELR